MTAVPEWREGQRVCVLGYGTTGGTHEHHTIVRLTGLYVISAKAGTDWTRRHRRRDGRSPGGSGYGGTTIAATCQRPKKST